MRGAARRQRRSGREKVDRLRRRDCLDVPRLELEQQDSLHELLLEIGIAELGRHDLAVGHSAVRRDSQAQHELAFERRVQAQRAIVQRVDGALVAIEDTLDLLTAARAAIAFAAALHTSRRSAARRTAANALDRTVDLRRIAGLQSAAARIATQRGRIDAAAARPGAGRDQSALGHVGGDLGCRAGGRNLGLLEVCRRIGATQRL